MPLAAKPATAPARPGLDGAPSRSAASRQASGPIESKGMSVRHKRACWPTRRGIHWLSGRTKSSTTAAQASSAGAIASARPLWARLPPGRPTLSITQIAVTASETVTTNLNRKRLLFTASEMSGRKPIPTKNKIAAMRIPPATAPAKIDRKRHGAESFTSSSMRSSVFTGATPIENSQRFQRTMQRDANGTLCHLEPVGCLPNAVAIERYGFDDLSLVCLQMTKQRIDFLCGQFWSLILGLQAVHHHFDRHADASPAPPQDVDQLVPGDRRHPGPNGPGLIPGSPLQVDREQHLLHNILSFAFWRAQPPTPGAGNSPYMWGQRHQELSVGARVAGHVRAHPHRPIVLLGRRGHLPSLTRRTRKLLQRSWFLIAH